MILGHYAAALAAKTLAPKTSLGTLTTAAILLDLIWPVLVIAGVEIVTVTPGGTAANPLTFVSYPWSHSLLTSIGWGVLFGGAYFAVRKNRTGAVVLGMLVVSHWLLDAAVHVPDLPIAPGDDVRIGLGLWNSIPLTLAVELGLFGAGIWVYLGSTKAQDRIGSAGFSAWIGLLLVIFAGVVFGPPPPSASAVEWSDFGQLLFVALGAWVDRHRRPSVQPG